MKTHTFTLAFGSYHVFGSGASGASLIIDDVKVTHAVAEQHGWPIKYWDNGFIGYKYVTVPSSVIARAKIVKYYRGNPGR